MSTVSPFRFYKSGPDYAVYHVPSARYIGRVWKGSGSRRQPPWRAVPGTGRTTEHMTRQDAADWLLDQVPAPRVSP